METDKGVYFVISFLLMLLCVGTVVYHHIEKWDYIDSVYFSTTTLATVGFGDVHPVTNADKLFTVTYILVGVSAALYGLSLIAHHYLNKKVHHFDKILKGITKRSAEPRKDQDIRLILKEIEEKEKEKSKAIKTHK